jgi:hypothetical protein
MKAFTVHDDVFEFVRFPDAPCIKRATIHLQMHLFSLLRRLLCGPLKCEALIYSWSNSYPNLSLVIRNSKLFASYLVIVLSTEAMRQ